MTNKFHLNTRFENGGFDAEPWFMAITEPENIGVTVTVQHRSEVEAHQYAPSHCDWLVQIDTDNTMSETNMLIRNNFIELYSSDPNLQKLELYDLKGSSVLSVDLSNLSSSSGLKYPFNKPSGIYIGVISTTTNSIRMKLYNP